MPRRYALTRPLWSLTQRASPRLTQTLILALTCTPSPPQHPAHLTSALSTQPVNQAPALPSDLCPSNCAISVLSLCPWSFWG